MLTLAPPLRDEADRVRTDLRTSAVPIRPAQKVRDRRRLWEVGVELPVDHEGGVFIWRVLRPNDQRSQQVRPVLVRADEDGVCWRRVSQPIQT